MIWTHNNNHMAKMSILPIPILQVNGKVITSLIVHFDIVLNEDVPIDKRNPLCNEAHLKFGL